MRIQLGKIKDQFVTLPKFLFSIHKRQGINKRLVIIGRLYRGYVGALIHIRGYEINIWIYKLEVKK